MHCCLWFRSVFRVRGPWPKRYGYHLSIIYIYIYIYIYTDMGILISLEELASLAVIICMHVVRAVAVMCA